MKILVKCEILHHDDIYTPPRLQECSNAVTYFSNAQDITSHVEDLQRIQPQNVEMHKIILVVGLNLDVHTPCS